MSSMPSLRLAKASSPDSLIFVSFRSRIATIEPVSLDGVAYRHVAPRYDCASGEGAKRLGGRWNPAGSFPTVYMALSPETARAELMRAADLQGVALEDLLPRDLCNFEVDLRLVLNLRAEENVREFQVTRDALIGDDRGTCQEIGLRAYQSGFEAISAPSATGVGDVLAVFLENLTPRMRVERLPATMVREDF